MQEPNRHVLSMTKLQNESSVACLRPTSREKPATNIGVQVWERRTGPSPPLHPFFEPTEILVSTPNVYSDRRRKESIMWCYCVLLCSCYRVLLCRM